MLPFYRSARAKLVANDSGQAMVEFAFIVPMLLILMCAAIDFGRALYTLQVIAQLTRQGSSLSSRIDTCSAGSGLGEPKETLTCSTLAVIAGESGLNIATSGEVIMTAVENTGTTASPTYTMEGQYSQGGLSQTSKVGTYSTKSGAANTATLPVQFSATTGNQPLQAGQVLYVTEIFYKFKAITPIGTLTQNWPVKGTGVALPTLLYDAAYF